MELESDKCICNLNESDMFSSFEKQIELEEGYWEDVYNRNTSDSGPLEFKVSPLADTFVDLNNTMLHVELSIKKPKGEDLAATDDIAPINNILHSLFSDVSLNMGNNLVEGGTGLYAYKAYMKNLLIMSQSSKSNQLAASGWYTDKSGLFEEKTNSGYKARQKLMAKSKKFQLCGPLLLDIAQQNRFILQNTEMKFTLTKCKPEFLFMIKTEDSVTTKATAVEVKITEAILYVRRVKASPNTIIQIENQLNHKNAILPLQRTKMITYTIPKGSKSDNNQNLFDGVLPKAVFVGLVNNDAFNGSYTNNPYNFQHFDVSKMVLYGGGQPIPIKGYTPDYSSDLFMKEYVSLMQSLDIFNKNENNGIKLDDFSKGNAIYGFNLSPNLIIGGLSHPSRNGQLRLEIQFSKELQQSVNVIVMSIYDAEITITKTRNVLMDWK